MTFFESEYLLENPNVAAAVNSGFFLSGFDHYLQFGAFEQRTAAFTGTTGNDVLPELPVGVAGGEIDLIGVPVTLDAQGDRIYQTVTTGDGGGGFDTLVGGSATDIFILGESGQDFYNGIDSNVIISNFDPSVDIIQLGKENNSFITNYSIGFVPGETDLTIIARSTTGTGLAVVENVVDPFTGELLIDESNFRFGSQTPPTGEPLALEVSFVEGEYLANNPDINEAVNNGFISSGLEHYLNFGINESRAAVFSGTNGSDIVSPVGAENNFVEITGVAVDYFFERDYLSDGIREFDRLFGTPGVNEFILGTTRVITPIILPVAVPFYLGEGQATIVDFNQFEGDYIELFKQSVDNIQFFPSGNDLVIEYQSVENDIIEVDTIATIEGGANLNLTQNIETFDDFFGIDRVILF